MRYLYGFFALIAWLMFLGYVQTIGMVVTNDVSIISTAIIVAGTMAVWLAETAKVVGMTFELFNGVKVDGTQIIGYFSAESKKMCSEIIGNMIAQTLVEYSEV